MADESKDVTWGELSAEAVRAAVAKWEAAPAEAKAMAGAYVAPLLDAMQAQQRAIDGLEGAVKVFIGGKKAEAQRHGVFAEQLGKGW